MVIPVNIRKIMNPAKSIITAPNILKRNFCKYELFNFWFIDLMFLKACRKRIHMAICARPPENIVRTVSTPI